MAETCLDQRAQVATCEVSYCIMLGRSKSGAIECNNCNIPCTLHMTCGHHHHSLFAFIHPPEMFRRRRIIGEPPTFSRSGSIEDGQLLILLRCRGARRCAACNMSRRCHIAPTRHPPPLQQLSDLCLGAVQPGSELCPDI